jgi:MATE family multidrug resistance protein
MPARGWWSPATTRPSSCRSRWTCGAGNLVATVRRPTDAKDNVLLYRLRSRPLMSELRIIARHAGTVLVGQLATMAFGVTDTMIAGRYAADALAALSVGSAVYISMFVALHGRGAGAAAGLGGTARRRPRSRRWAARCGRRCTWPGGRGRGLASCCFPARCCKGPRCPRAAGRGAQYLGVLALALPPALLFRMFSTLNQALGKPVLVTWLQLGVAGGEGAAVDLARRSAARACRRWALAGCAWATVVVNYLLVALRSGPSARGRSTGPSGSGSAWSRRTGRPCAASRAWASRRPVVMVEVTSFTLMALFIARLGTLASAATRSPAT